LFTAEISGASGHLRISSSTNPSCEHAAKAAVAAEKNKGKEPSKQTTEKGAGSAENCVAAFGHSKGRQTFQKIVQIS
jgi:ribosomal 30S subunit maturation factor RimM